MFYSDQEFDLRVQHLVMVLGMTWEEALVEVRAQEQEDQLEFHHWLDQQALIEEPVICDPDNWYEQQYEVEELA